MCSVITVLQGGSELIRRFVRTQPAAGYEIIIHPGSFAPRQIYYFSHIFSGIRSLCLH